MIYYTQTGKNWSIQKQIIPYSYEFRSVVNEYPLTNYIVIFSGEGLVVDQWEDYYFWCWYSIFAVAEI